MNIPNLLSFTRIPLAFLFLQTDPTIRALAVLCALFSDGLDGYFARRLNQTTRLGTLLDPLTDRFFVGFALGVLFLEGEFSPWKVGAIFSRDGAILLFGCFLLFKGELNKYYFRALWCGKITTVLQLTVLFTLTMGVSVPDIIYYAFYVLGVLALVELSFSSPAIAEP